MAGGKAGQHDLENGWSQFPYGGEDQEALDFVLAPPMGLRLCLHRTSLSMKSGPVRSIPKPWPVVLMLLGFAGLELLG
jgi:hypothetical protein